MISDEAGFRKEFERYVKLLSLGTWHIRLQFPSQTADEWAHVIVSPNTGEATVNVGPDLLKQPWSLQRTVMLHELMHMMVRDMSKQFASIIETLDITARERALIDAALDQQEELVVDRLARALEPVL